MLYSWNNNIIIHATHRPCQWPGTSRLYVTSEHVAVVSYNLGQDCCEPTQVQSGVPNMCLNCELAMSTVLRAPQAVVCTIHGHGIAIWDALRTIMIMLQLVGAAPPSPAQPKSSRPNK